MTPNQLANLATAAYGKDWKMLLAEDTKISREMLWRYQHKETKISDRIRELVIKACRKRIAEKMEKLQKAIDVLDRIEAAA